MWVVSFLGNCDWNDVVDEDQEVIVVEDKLNGYNWVDLDFFSCFEGDTDRALLLFCC
jgi:hypothetical protein